MSAADDGELIALTRDEHDRWDCIVIDADSSKRGLLQTALQVGDKVISPLSTAKFDFFGIEEVKKDPKAIREIHSLCSEVFG